MHIRVACCLQAWVSELGRIDLQYIADRIRTPGEVNGKSANLNNALNHIFPPGTAIGFNEVLQQCSSIRCAEAICVFADVTLLCLCHSDASAAALLQMTHGLLTLGSDPCRLSAS
jgi:hypothetical protein